MFINFRIRDTIFVNLTRFKSKNMCKKAFFYFNLDPKIDRGIVSSNSEMAEWSLRDLATVIRRSGGGMWLLMMNIDGPSEIHI